MESGYPLAALATSSLIGAALTTVPFAWIWVNSDFGREKPVQLHRRYIDEDGCATAESEAAFTNAAPRRILLGASLIGASSAFAINLTEASHWKLLSVDSWGRFFVWFLLVTQVSLLFASPRFTLQYTLAKFIALGGLLTSITLTAQILQTWHQGLSQLYSMLLAIQFLMALVVSIAGVSLPRRPDVYHNGCVVDRRFTVTFLKRWTFAWALSTLRNASKYQKLELQELATTDHTLRASVLCSEFEESQSRGSLWSRILYLYKFTFVALFAVQLIESLSSFGPDLLLYVLLRLLEDRDNASSDQALLYVVAIGMGLSIVFNDWFDCLQIYIWRQRLEIPISVQLSAGLFSKSIRAKNVIGTSETNKELDSEYGDLSQTKQSVINLMNIDADKVADFSSAVNSFLDAFLQIVISIVFLVKLIGWVALASGLFVPLILSPVNLFVTRRYMNAENHLMSARDQKTTTINEALQGIRQIKFSALEAAWYKTISQVRQSELAWQWKIFSLDLWLIAIWQLGPIILSATSLTVYTIMNGNLSASVAFTSISIFNSLESGLARVPALTSLLMDALVSAKRIDAYFKSPEQEQNHKSNQKVVCRKATLAWPSEKIRESDFKLGEVDLAFEMGELNVISGKTGSGKSLLLNGIIGEANIISGEVTVPETPSRTEWHTSPPHSDRWILQESMAYVAQSPWIENATFRDNILFHLPYNDTRYRQTIHACALEPDLSLLIDGDETEIGANGVNLSGGQKWRVSLARALYSRAGILVMDDIFSAVDTNVGRHLYEHAITGVLSRGRTIVLATHHVDLCLPSTRYSVLLHNGRVLYAGPTRDLQQDKTKFGSLKVDKDLPEESSSTNQVSSLSRSRHNFVWNEETTQLALQGSQSPVSARTPEVFTSSETREVGSVKLIIYKGYLKACRGYWYWILVMVLFSALAVIELGRSYWITLWTRSGDRKVQNITVLHYEGIPFPRLTQYSYATIYIIISLLEGLTGMVKQYAVYWGSIHGSKVLFEAMTQTILKTSLQFLDTTPVGRLNNRFSSDFSQIDSSTASELGFMLDSVISIIGVVVAAMFVSPYMLIFSVVLGPTIWFLGPLYVRAAREVNRLESITRSPIFEQYGSALIGLASIRAFGMADVYIDRMHGLMNDNMVATYHLSLFARWIHLRLGLIGAAFTLLTAVVIIGVPGIDASLAGFALSFSLQLSSGIKYLIRGYTDVEMNFNAVERVLEYTMLDKEPQGGNEPPATWPAKGELAIEDLSVSYAEHTPLVLQNINFSIQSHERVGVVGRTGAGKSSLTLALLRFLEPRSGSIRIDGIDIASLKLEALRSRLTIIPQNPVLFSGTIRLNLDPEQQHSDAELLDALSRVRLIPTSHNIIPTNRQNVSTGVTSTQTSFSLSTAVAEGGANFSHGQKQLLCLARAIVKRPKILILDEATSAVDMETDALIQQTLRQEFENTTLLVIAHRLSTVADFDRIIVLGNGRMVEYGTPIELIQRPTADGFRDLVMESGERRVVEGIVNSRSNLKPADT